ncbi:hypothetical protein FQA39_LY04130 [Lamprigera yunnana]|nr:hypothetical protein FQA39_LY04130 [Lamprigera yunnana]
MGKIKIVPKRIKSNIKGTIVKKKTIKPLRTAKNALIISTKRYLNEREMSPPITRQVVKLKSEKIEEEEDEQPIKNYVRLLKRSVDRDQVRRGVAAFYKYCETIKQKRKELFDEEQPIFLQIVCIKIPQTTVTQVRLHLEHSLVMPNSEICLIVADRGRRREHESTIEYYEELLEKKGITNIKTIMPYHQFKYEYGSQFELKRKLLHLYDYFLVDAKISGYVTHRLGSIFMKSRKMPVCVKMDTPDLQQHFNMALKKTILKLHSKGDTYSVQIGHSFMTEDQICGNVLQAANEFEKVFPGGFENIRLLGVKGESGMLIPIYLTLKNKNEVEVPIYSIQLPKQHTVVEGELSTFVNASVRVGPDGKVILRKGRSIKNEVENDKNIDIKKEIKSEKKIKKENKPNEEMSDEENDSLEKEEELYLNYFHHEQNEAQKDKKRRSTKNKSSEKLKSKMIKKKN